MSCVLLHLFIIHLYSLQVRRSPVPVIYYTNLLLSNLIQICIMIVWLLRIGSSIPAVIHLSCVMASLYFRMCIALERYFFIAFPLLNYIRQPKGSVLVFVLLWVLCIVSAALAVTTEDVSRLIIHAFFPAPVLIFCLAGTIKALPAATSVSIEEKRRIVGTLVLLLFNYFLINLPAVNLSIYLSGNTDQYCIAFLIFFLFNHFVDFTLFIFMQNGPIDKLLACMYCCSFETCQSTNQTHMISSSEFKLT
uniref:G-protein coupled receptors family 1 profile domain-containing protein n=1 Tax=Haplochromis burtoni TaxID=8153 RepID=A0A3Q2WIB8_HAPBU